MRCVAKGRRNAFSVPFWACWRFRGSVASWFWFWGSCGVVPASTPGSPCWCFGVLEVGAPASLGLRGAGGGLLVLFLVPWRFLGLLWVLVFPSRAFRFLLPRFALYVSFPPSGSFFFRGSLVLPSSSHVVLPVVCATRKKRGACLGCSNHPLTIFQKQSVNVFQEESEVDVNNAPTCVQRRQNPM